MHENNNSTPLTPSALDIINFKFVTVREGKIITLILICICFAPWKAFFFEWTAGAKLPTGTRAFLRKPPHVPNFLHNEGSLRSRKPATQRLRTGTSDEPSARLLSRTLADKVGSRETWGRENTSWAADSPVVKTLALPLTVYYFISLKSTFFTCQRGEIKRTIARDFRVAAYC